MAKTAGFDSPFKREDRDITRSVVPGDGGKRGRRGGAWDHPLQQHLQKHGEGLHHLCFLVPDVPAAVATLPALGLAQRGNQLHRGPRGRKAAFVDPAGTRGVLLEFTG